MQVIKVSNLQFPYESVSTVKTPTINPNNYPMLKVTVIKLIYLPLTLIL